MTLIPRSIYSGGSNNKNNMVLVTGSISSFILFPSWCVSTSGTLSKWTLKNAFIRGPKAPVIWLADLHVMKLMAWPIVMENSEKNITFIYRPVRGVNESQHASFLSSPQEK